MILFPPELIKVDEDNIRDIDSYVSQIYRNVIFNRNISSTKLLEKFKGSTNNLTELLSIKNAQMEAQDEVELKVYLRNLKNAIIYIISEIKNDIPFTKITQLFNLFRILSPESYQIHPNRYRDTLVMVGNHICPNAKEIPNLVSHLFQNMKEISHPITKAIYFHHELIRIHPFVDGNGRVTRIAKNWILMYELYPPIFIKNEIDKKKYISALNNSFQSLRGTNPVWNDKISIFFRQETNRILQNVLLILKELKNDE